MFPIKTLLYKEFVWNWRSFRFPALVLVFLFFAFLNPPTVKYMNEIMTYFGEIELTLPEPTAEEAFFSVLSDLSQIGVLVLIFVAMGIVAKEKETGVAAWVLSKPVSRWKYLVAKLVNLYGAVILGLMVAAAAGYLYTWSLLGQVAIDRAVWSTVSLIAFALLFATVTFTCSTILKTPLQAGGVTVLVFFLSGILLMLVGESPLRKFYPNTLLSEVGPLINGSSGPADIVGPLIVSLGLSVLLVAIAAARFSKMEL